MASKPGVSVGIIGAAGYVAGELLRLFIKHPQAHVIQAVSASQKGLPLESVHPHLRGLTDLVFSAELDAARVEVVFFCGPHGTSMLQIPKLMERAPSLKVIDLTGDFRLKSPDLYPAWYGRTHLAPNYLPQFIYGLPELNRESIAKTNRIANPGCFATAIALALGPLASAGLGGCASVTAITGSSGSGAKPSEKTHHPRRAATLCAYKLLEHQHTPEIVQTLGDFRRRAQRSISEIAVNSTNPDASSENEKMQLALVPISGPYVRGIYACCSLDIENRLSPAEIKDLFRTQYLQEPFIRLLSAPPDLNVVTGSNFCDLFVDVKQGKVVVISAIDNLVKGASGQAIQNLNIMMGWPEESGLDQAALYP